MSERSYGALKASNQGWQVRPGAHAPVRCQPPGRGRPAGGSEDGAGVGRRDEEVQGECRRSRTARAPEQKPANPERQTRPNDPEQWAGHPRPHQPELAPEARNPATWTATFILEHGANRNRPYKSEPYVQS